MKNAVENIRKIAPKKLVLISTVDVYKAPNGKDTNLTPKQWAQVRTKAFKKWFGDWEMWFKKNSF